MTGIFTAGRLATWGWRRVCVVALISLTPLAALAQDVALEARVASLTAGASIGGAVIAAPDFVRDFYARRAFRQAWRDSAAGAQLRSEIEASATHGFRPEDFHSAALGELSAAARSGDTKAAAAFEIVATDAAVRLLHHLYFGKVDPDRLDPDWNFARPIIDGDPVTIVNEYVDSGEFNVLVDDLSLKHPAYLRMQAALARYREIEAAGGWPVVPGGTILKPGMEDAQALLLRQRLAVTGDFSGPVSASLFYDSALEVAVKRFQTRHGLDADGVVGGKTLEALNTPVSLRIDQIRLTLERARWILRGLSGDFVLVNIAGAETFLVRNGEVVWRTRSITGQQYRKTPVFRDEIKYMDINPTWTVPVSIFRKDKLPKIRKDLSYLARGGYTVRNSKGLQLEARSVNWSDKNPGVTLVQEPGPKNALGLVKFMFPNKYAVYLHDTPNRDLFDRSERYLSSGCVRVENPFVFADLLMEGDPAWSEARREEILASGKTTRINLPKPMPVMLTYYTAWMADGQMQFRRDIYDRDGPLLKALDGAFRR